MNNNIIITDSMRWQFIKENLLQTMDWRMDGTCLFRFRSPYGRGSSIDEVIDNMIKNYENIKTK